MRPQSHRVILTAEQRASLERTVTQGSAAARTITRARILLKADQGAEGPAWTDARICTALDVSRGTVVRLRTEFAARGLDIIAHRKPAEARPLKIAGTQEAHLIALTCSPAPEGHAQWTLRLLTERYVGLGVGEPVSYETVRRTLKKVSSSRG